MLIVISKDSGNKDCKAVNALFQRGLELFHLRKPDFSINDMIDWISNIDKKYHNKITVHSHFELLNSYNIGGVHLNLQRTEDLGLIRRTDFRKSYSCHSLEEVKAFSSKFDYVFLSPVFDSISKIGYKSKFDLSILKEEIPKMAGKIIALGGINKTNAKSCIDMGFSGIALLGAIWHDSDNIINNFLEFSDV